MLFISLLVIGGCGKDQSSTKNRDLVEVEPTIEPVDEDNEVPLIEPIKDDLSTHDEIDDTSFVYLENWSVSFSYDMKYAGTDNFIKMKVYDCDKCLVRKEVALALIEANEEFNSIGFHIKFFDCYRPLEVQKIMWKIYPVEGYVANPYNGGSNHNRGGAVDVTLVDENGDELDMGTAFDFFGKEAHHDYQELSSEVLQNREILKSIMEKYGFKAINMEWWHYNFNSSVRYPLSNFKTNCNN